MAKSKFENEIDLTKLPQHIAIIMDGNGRWAQKLGFNRIRGHRAGVETIREIVTFASQIGIRYLTLYAFSVENWGRPKQEVNMLMRLLEEYLEKELQTFKDNNIKFNTIGFIEDLPQNIQRLILRNKEQTDKNTGLLLTLALNYSGRSEITDAVKRIVKDKINPEDINETTISNYLFTSKIPDPDLLIRTSGEMRISNYLLWQISYTELWVTPVLWPEFRKKDLLEAIKEYQKRERRFGKV